MSRKDKLRFKSKSKSERVCKGVFCFAFLFSIFTISSFSDTLSDNPQCDNNTLHTTTGSATLNAKWNANTIRLIWEPGENTDFTAPLEGSAAYSCEYEGGLTFPTAPTRSGYTFGGWVVRAAQCNLSEYYPADYAIDWGYRNDRNNLSGASSWKADEYGLENDQTWAVEFANGILKGRALCSTDVSTDYIGRTGTPNESGRGQYCWCAATDFGNSCHITSPSWIYYGNLNEEDLCAKNCASTCGYNLTSCNDTSGFCAKIFGL